MADSLVYVVVVVNVQNQIRKSLGQLQHEKVLKSFSENNV